MHTCVGAPSDEQTSLITIDDGKPNGIGDCVNADACCVVEKEYRATNPNDATKLRCDFIFSNFANYDGKNDGGGNDDKTGGLGACRPVSASP